MDLRDRFRLSTSSIAESEAKQDNMKISQSVIDCISDLAFKYAELLAEDLEMFANHAGRKSVNMNDVIISAHRNKHLTDVLRKKKPQSEKKSKKSSNKEGKSLPHMSLEPNLVNPEEQQARPKRIKKSPARYLD
ncbi:hypothetical protein LXL04_028514 [Taraxacum kok-saghyz]